MSRPHRCARTAARTDAPGRAKNMSDGSSDRRGGWGFHGPPQIETGERCGLGARLSSLRLHQLASCCVTPRSSPPHQAASSGATAKATATSAIRNAVCQAISSSLTKNFETLAHLIDRIDFWRSTACRPCAAPCRIAPLTSRMVGQVVGVEMDRARRAVDQRQLDLAMPSCHP